MNVHMKHFSIPFYSFKHIPNVYRMITFCSLLRLDVLYYKSDIINIWNIWFVALGM